MSTENGNSLIDVALSGIDVALSGIVVAAEQVGKDKAMLALAPRLEAADALAEALRLTEDYLDHIGTCETKWACPDCGIKRSRAYDARVKALAAYDAGKKGEADGHR